MPRKGYAQELVRLRHGRPVEELLRDLYVDKKYSQEEIARALGVSRGAIVAWLLEYGISREDRPPIETVMSA